MKLGRINERNIGHWSLDGEPKQRRKRNEKIKPEKQLTEIEKQAKEHFEIIKSLIRSDENRYYTYLRWDMKNPILKEFADTGLIKKGKRKSKFPQYIDDIEICKVANKRKLENAKKTILELYPNIFE